MPRAFSTVPTRAAACTGVNRAWILRSARASSADLEGAAVPAVRVPLQPPLPGSSASRSAPGCTFGATPGARGLPGPEGQRAAAEASARE